MSDDEETDDEMTDAKMAAAEADLVATAADRADPTTIVAAIEAGGLSATLASDGPFTIFAPSYDAVVAYLGEMGMTAEDDLADWTVRIEGPDGEPLDELDMSAFEALPQRDMVISHKCIEGWASIVHWRGWREGHFVFSLTKGRQKFENLVRNPTIAISGIDPDSAYRYLEMRGAVVSIDDDSSSAFIDSMAHKYMGVDSYPFHQPGDERVVMVVEVVHTTQMGS